MEEGGKLQVTSEAVGYRFLSPERSSTTLLRTPGFLADLGERLGVQFVDDPTRMFDKVYDIDVEVAMRPIESSFATNALNAGRPANLKPGGAQIAVGVRPSQLSVSIDDSIKVPMPIGHPDKGGHYYNTTQWVNLDAQIGKPATKITQVGTPIPKP